MNVNSIRSESELGLASAAGVVAARGKKEEAAKAASAAAEGVPTPARAADAVEITAETTPTAVYVKPPITPPPTPAAQPTPSVASAPAAPPAQPTPGGAQQAPGSTTDGVQYTQSDLDGLLGAYGARAGDALFNSAYDLDGDGSISFADLNRVLSNFNANPQAASAPPVAPAAPTPGGASSSPTSAATEAQTGAAAASVSTPAPAATAAAAATSTAQEATGAAVAAEEAVEAPGNGPASVAPTTAQATPTEFNQEDLPALLFAYGRHTGEPGFEARFDFNADGVIGFDDLNSALSRISPGANAHAQTLEGLVSAFGLREGQSGFNVKFDFDGDGHIGFADLNRLLDDLFGQ